MTSIDLDLPGVTGPERRSLVLRWDHAEGVWRTPDPCVAVRAAGTDDGRVHHRAFRLPPADPRHPERGPAAPVAMRTPRGPAYPTAVPEVRRGRRYLVVAWADALPATGAPGHDDRPVAPDPLAWALDTPHDVLATAIAAGADPLGIAFEALVLRGPAAARAGRERLARRFAWAVPDEGALGALAGLGPWVEVGAGTGYWAALLAARGGDVLAFDRAPAGGPRANRFHPGAHAWHPVLAGDAAAAAEHPDRGLLLVWPPYLDPMAADALAAYEGRTLAHVGEGRWGCTGDDRFWDLLEAGGWRPQPAPRLARRWPGIRDELSVWRRP